MGSQLSSLKDVQGGVIIGVGNMEQALGSNLTENGERNNKKEQVPTSMFTELHKITHVLTQNREEGLNGLVTSDRKSNGLTAEVLTSVNTLIQNHSGSEWKEHGASRVRHGRTSMPYHLGVRN